MKATLPQMLISLLSPVVCCCNALLTPASAINSSANALTAASPQVRSTHIFKAGLDNDPVLVECVSHRRSSSRMVRHRRPSPSPPPGLSTKGHLPRRHRRSDVLGLTRLEQPSTADSILGASIPLPTADLRWDDHGTRGTGQECGLVHVRHAEPLQ